MKPKGSVALVGNVLDVLVPHQVVSDSDPKVAAGFFCLKYISMQLVLRLYYLLVPWSYM